MNQPTRFDQPSLDLAPSQYQVWLDQQSFPGSAHLTIGGNSTFNGELDIARLEAALVQLVDENIALRLLPGEDGQQQVVDSWPGPLIDYDELQHQPQPETTVLKQIEQTMAKPFLFDGKSRPWAVYVRKVADSQYRMWVGFHHIMMDGFSMAVLFENWSAIYNQKASPNQTDPLDFDDFIDDCKSYQASEIYQKDRAFWHDYLPSLPPAILHKRFGKEQNSAMAKGIHQYDLISRQDYRALGEFAKNYGLTVNHLFMAALSIYFCRTANKHQILLGIPVLNRKGKRFKNTIGMFSAVIPLLVNVSPTQSVAQLLKEIAISLRAIYRHSRYPLYQLTRERNLLDSGRDSMFDVFLSFEPHNLGVYFGQSQQCHPRKFIAQNARYPLLVNLGEYHSEAPVELAIEASSDYFTEQGASQLSQRLQAMLKAIADNPDCQTQHLPLMSADERYDLLVSKHADIPCHSHTKPFITTFEHLAALNPNATALHWLDEHNTEQQMSYSEFNAQANRLAHHLLGQSFKPNDIVAVLAPRLPQTLISYFAIAKIGAAYLPIDPDTNIERIELLLGHCTAPAVLSGGNSIELPNQRKTIDIDTLHGPLYDQALPNHNPDIELNPDGLAVVLFTSGSTGAPKGVMMNHSGLAKRMAWLARTFHFGPKDVALQSIQLTFDPSLIEILLPLTHGGSVALPPPGKLAPTAVAKYCERFGATYISIVPTIMRYVCQSASEHPDIKLKAVGCGGERLTRALAQQFSELTGATVYNFWGLTETTIFATSYAFDPATGFDPLPVGEPIDDTTVYILDDNLNPLPQGVTGQIYVGGSALSLGYLNEPQLSAEKFIDNPFEPENRLFVTGDLGYFDDQGQLQFVSRIDSMLKVRGQRVEPTQVEAALTSLSFVKGAAVKLHEEQLHGWIEPNHLMPDDKLDILEQNLSEALLRKLPAYMVPSGFTQVETLPRQSGGKLDYKALVYDPMAAKYQASTQHQVEPQNDLEQVLLTLWQQTLKAPELQVTSDFFKFGGNSLDALNLLGAIEKQLSHRLPLTTLLQNSTVRDLAKAIMHQHAPIEVLLSDNEQGIPLYLAASGHGDAMRLEPLAKALSGRYHIRMLQPPMHQDYIKYQSLTDLAEHYAELIERNSHQHPPVLAGFSIGGTTALETARILITKGVSIKALVLIDSSYPSWLLRHTPAWRLAAYLVNKLSLQELSINQRTLGSLFSDPGLNGQIQALSSYQPKPLSYPVTLVISAGLKKWYGRFIRPWRKLFGEHLSEQHLPGFHGNLFAESQVDNLANVFIDLDKKPSKDHTKSYLKP